MKPVKDLCIRLINRKTYDIKEISNMIEIYYNKKKLTDDEYSEIKEIISEAYNKESGDK